MSKTIIITGASDGIGKAAARRLHAQGHTVVLVGRSPDKTKALASELGSAYYLADFSRLSDVRTLARNIKRDYKRIDVLACNAGGIIGTRTVTKDGFELTFQLNHLAHFLLVGLLMNVLIKSQATVISTSSAAHYFGRFDHDFNRAHHYKKWRAYGNAKLMNILFTRELNRRYAKKGIAAAAFHPGVVRTSFSRDLGPVAKFFYASPASRLLGMVSPERGADTLVWLAENQPGQTWESGGYYVRRKVAHTSSAARSSGNANELWNASEDLLLDKLEY